MPEDRIPIAKWDDLLLLEEKFRTGASVQVEARELAALVRLAVAALAEYECMDEPSGEFEQAIAAFDFTRTAFGWPKARAASG